MSEKVVVMWWWWYRCMEEEDGVCVLLCLCVVVPLCERCDVRCVRLAVVWLFV